MSGNRQVSARARRRKKGFPFFWTFFLLFVVVMVVFWFRVVKYVRETLVLYEESQPANTMEKLMDQFRTTGLDQYMTVVGDISRFETKEDYAEEFRKELTGKILFHLPAKGIQDPDKPCYELFADGEHIGYCTLKEVAAEQYFFGFLTMSEWALDSVELEGISGSKAVEVTAPQDLEVWINGVRMDERELTGDTTVSEEFTYVKDYVAVPVFVTYRAEGLLKEPLVEVKTCDGQTLLSVHGKAVSNQDYTVALNGQLTSVVANGFQESEMPSDLKNMVLEQTERYTNFFSVDLPGCRGSVSPIADMFPADSYYLELADTYRREDMWMYSSHNAPVFKNETVGHYIRYSEDLFSCEVYFDKEMLLHKTGKVKVDTTNFRLYYGLLDGKWKILDMVTLLGEEE